MILKPLDKYVFKWSNSKFYNWEFLTNASKNLKRLQKLDETSKLSSSEITRRNEMSTEIKKEVKRLEIDQLPMFYIDDKKYIGYYSPEQLRKIIEKALQKNKQNSFN